jgi:pimeloyl-ACP methyl ester carboxylesterase
MPTMSTSLGPISYSDEGDGPPVLLLHAALHDRTDYDAVRGPLLHRHRVLAVDWPGHGESPLPDIPLTAAQFGNLAIELVDGLDLSNVVVIGNSVGGYAAARLAIERPRRISGLVLVNTGGFTGHNAGTRVVCLVMGKESVVRLAFPVFVRTYMRARTAADRAIVSRVVARAKTHDGARTAAALWRSFTDPRHDLRPQCGGNQRACAHHVGCQGCHRTSSLGRSRADRNSRVLVPHVYHRACGVLVGARRMAGHRVALHRVRAACLPATRLTHSGTTSAINP